MTVGRVVCRIVMPAAARYDMAMLDMLYQMKYMIWYWAYMLYQNYQIGKYVPTLLYK